jgi:UDP-2,3-diacylglucosamine hydrolase
MFLNLYQKIKKDLFVHHFYNMIGLVLGDTHIGDEIIKGFKKYKKKFIIIDISKSKKFKKFNNSFQLSIGQLGKCISILKKNKCKEVLFAGRVNKPNFKKIKFDLKAIYHLPKIIKETKKGDAYIINFITNLFEKEGFKIISQVKYNKEIVLKKGSCTILKPNKIDKIKILSGKKIIYDLKRIGVEQGVIVLSKEIFFTENLKGTDSLIKESKSEILKYKNKNKGNRLGILIKLPKPNQDLRTDLPTIGYKTIKNCISAGLRGVVIKSKFNIFLDKQKCIKLANKKGFFIHAI